MGLFKYLKPWTNGCNIFARNRAKLLHDVARGWTEAWFGETSAHYWGQTGGTCCVQECCANSNVASVWPGLWEQIPLLSNSQGQGTTLWTTKQDKLYWLTLRGLGSRSVRAGRKFCHYQQVRRQVLFEWAYQTTNEKHDRDVRPLLRQQKCLVGLL